MEPGEARAAEMQEEVEEWPPPYGMVPPPQPPPQQQAAPPPVNASVLLFSGAETKVNFFGVGADSAYLNPSGVGLKRGPTGKAEYMFSRLVSLDVAGVRACDGERAQLRYRPPCRPTRPHGMGHGRHMGHE